MLITNKRISQNEWLVLVEFVNNKVHLITKVFLFMPNYKRELRMGIDVRRKGNMEKITEFTEKMKKKRSRSIESEG